MNSPVDFTSATKVASGCCADMSRASLTPTRPDDSRTGVNSSVSAKALRN
jgi:hypothetical protein